MGKASILLCCDIILKAVWQHLVNVSMCTTQGPVIVTPCLCPMEIPTHVIAKGYQEDIHCLMRSRDGELETIWGSSLGKLRMLIMES